MRKIKMYVDAIKDEVNGAKEYAEKYVECKAAGHMERANRYKEMANDELKHAMYQHEMAVEEIEKLSKVYTPPVKMQEEWDKTHKEYAEHSAWIKHILML